MNAATRASNQSSWSSSRRKTASTPGAVGSEVADSREIDRWGDLMEKAQNGDLKAYRLLLSELQAWLRRYYSRRLPTDRVADAVQEALLAAHSNRHSYTPSRPFGPWIAAIARYKWIDFIREHSRARLVELDETISVPDHAAPVTAGILVEELLQRLKPSQATAIRVVKLEGESVESAARRTGQSEALVKVNVHRGIRKLAAMMD
jgi:RNA polymerase sigma factor (sigma-70 family)